MKANASPLSLLVLPAIFLFCISCNGEEEKEETRKDGYTVVLKTREDSLYHDVMNDHNIAMARMGKLSKYIQEVQRQLDSTRQLSLARQRAARAHTTALDSLGVRLRAAETSMNVWMDQFSLDSAGVTNQNRLHYLENEKLRVLKVKDDILTSLEQADSLFSKQGRSRKN